MLRNEEEWDDEVTDPEELNDQFERGNDERDDGYDDVLADSDALASAGMGMDEDYNHDTPLGDFYDDPYGDCY